MRLYTLNILRTARKHTAVFFYIGIKVGTEVKIANGWEWTPSLQTSPKSDIQMQYTDQHITAAIFNH